MPSPPVPRILNTRGHHQSSRLRRSRPRRRTGRTL